MEFTREIKPPGFLKPLHPRGEKIVFRRGTESFVSALAHEGYIFATPHKSLAQGVRLNAAAGKT